MAKWNSEKRKEKRTLIYNKCNGRCAYCGDELDISHFHSDHIVPKRRYKYPEFNKEVCGTDDIENLFPCCASCNSCKSDLSIESFRERIYDRVFRLNKFSSEYVIAKRFGIIKEIGGSVIFYFETIK